MTAYDLDGKVALVTGAARGIGFETARQLQLEGATVVLVDLDQAETDRAARRIGSRTLGIVADVSDRGQVESAVARSVEAFGGLDVVVANAGIAPSVGSALRTDSSEWERVIAVNLVGVWHTCQAALPQIVERRGHVVLVASVYAFVNGVLISSYATAKAGVESLGRSMRAELEPHGASASVAYFGFIDTKMVRDAFADPLAQRLERGLLPEPGRRRLPPEAAGRAIVEGVRARKARIVAPSWWRALSVLRGAINPLLDRRMAESEEIAALIREADSRGAGPGGPAS